MVFLPKAEEQFQERRLTASRLTDDADNLTLPGVHTNIGKHLRLSVVRKGQIRYLQVVILYLFTVLYGCYSGFLCKQIQHSVTACKGLCEVSGQGRNCDNGTKRAEHCNNTDNHFANGQHIVCYKSNTDCKCSDNKQRNTQLGCRTCLCGVVLHLPGFTKQNIGTVVDLFFTFLACIIKDNVFNALDTVKEIGIE